LAGELARLLAGQPVGLYLLRPDRYVAAFFPLPEIASAADAIERLISSTTGTSPLRAGGEATQR
jgi:hypothetical protein